MLRRLLFVFALLCLPSLAFAAPVSYTGQLTESSTLVNGNRHIAVNIYANAVGGSPLYTQAESLAVMNGIYHTTLNAPDALWDGTDRWIGVSVNGGAELVPRVKVGWVPYAIHTPRPSPIFAFSPEHFVNVAGSTWAKLDSLTIAAPVNGNVIINASGFALRTGGASAFSLHLAISETVPAEILTIALSTTQSVPMAATYMTTTSAGTHMFYLWGKTAAADNAYGVNVQRFQALFIPN